MKNLTNEAHKIDTIKANITTFENSLDQYMNLDLSDNKVRSEIRIVLNKISDLENNLSVFVQSIDLD